MKYIIVLADGMADEPIGAIGNQTPLQYARTPMLDQLSKVSEIGMVQTIPEGMSPGSDTANLSVLGYDPKQYYTGRSPLEALSIGVDMRQEDIALRCNMVTLSEAENTYKERVILDHSASEISTEDAAVLLNAVKEEFESDSFHFYKGTSYRHLVIWEGGEIVDLTPPHDKLGQVIGDYLPKEDALYDMMKRSYDILVKHPINLKRKKQGLNPANSIWFWGAGTRPALNSFEVKTGKRGAMISAVDLLKGIAAGSGMKNIGVIGANGGLHTNYEGKAMAAADVLVNEGYDFVYVHIEAPDEMGHQGSLDNKIKSIEYIDEKVIKVISERLEKANEDYRMMVLPDHPTPVGIRTHTINPVPYLLYDSTNPANQTWNYNEEEALNSGNIIKEGYQLIDHLFSR